MFSLFFLLSFSLFSPSFYNDPVFDLFSKNYGHLKMWTVSNVVKQLHSSSIQPKSCHHAWLGKPGFCLDTVDPHIHECESPLCQVGSKLLFRRQPERMCVLLDRIKHYNDRNMNYVHNVATYFLFNFEKVI